jgi:hypothetical protein
VPQAVAQLFLKLKKSDAGFTTNAQIQRINWLNPFESLKTHHPLPMGCNGSSSKPRSSSAGDNLCLKLNGKSYNGLKLIQSSRPENDFWIWM